MCVFTNLYFVHNYYFYANTLFIFVLSGLTGLALLECLSKKRQLLFVLTVVPLFIVSLGADYFSNYYPRLFSKSYMGDIAQVIMDHTGEQDVLLVYKDDLDPSIPYYSHRRALMDEWNLPLADPKMKRALECLGGDKIKAMVVCGEKSNGFIHERIVHFHLNPVPIMVQGVRMFFSDESPGSPTMNSGRE